MANFLETIGRLFGGETAVRNVFGEPVRVGERAVLPVAKIVYGFGGGVSPTSRGGAARTGETAEGTAGGVEAGAGQAGAAPEREGGSGGGGGAFVRPLGVFDIGPEGVTYRPVVQPAWIAAALAAGLVLGFALGRATTRRGGD